MNAEKNVPGLFDGDEEHQELVNEAFRVHGKIMHNASLADAFMYEVFHHYAGTTRPIAQAIYFTLDSAKTKHTLTVRTARAGEADEDAIKAIDKLAAAIQKVIDGRNGIAHAFMLFDDPIFSDGQIKVMNPKAAHAKGRQGRPANPGAPKRPAPASNTVSLTSLQQSLRTSDQHLRAATLEFRAICQRIGRKTQVTLALF